MRRHQRLHHHHRTRTQPFDLFGEPSRDDTVPTPQWRTLPTQTREALTDLMMRLILDHAAGSHRPQAREARHDV